MARGDEVAPPEFVTLGKEPERLPLEPAVGATRALRNVGGIGARADLQAQMLRRDPLASRKDHRLHDDRLEFAHVAAPGVLLKPPDCLAALIRGAHGHAASQPGKSVEPPWTGLDHEQEFGEFSESRRGWRAPPPI